MIHIVIGTKAQLIKMAPIMRKLQDKGIIYNYISTGQHKFTMDEIRDNFTLKNPDHILYNGRDITSIIQMFFWAINILLKVLFFKKKIFNNNNSNNNKSGIVLVHGDTFSTLLGALMGKLAGLKVAHVESGLRSFNLFQPFPEELTRIATFWLADYMFCPGEIPLNNLKKFSKGKVKVNTHANTLLDSLNFALPAISNQDGVDIPNASNTSIEYGIVTLHRFENFQNKKATEKVVEAVCAIAEKFPLLFILHKPTQINLEKYNLLEKLKTHPKIELRPRYDYFKFIKLLIHAKFVVSDGGSNQEECFYLGKPVLLLRNVTERCEGLGKNVILSKFDSQIIENFLLQVDSYAHSRVEITNKLLSPSEIIINECQRYI
ncbi:MAG: UDP-N-acetylglucosamine 2-epimerase [Oligoflexia bacterium]|nr:UDP-N-acetylglucosamine 2-epimerase [Oligoflexia bacterium]